MQQPTPTSNPNPGFLRERQLRQQGFAPFAHSTLWRMVAEGRFPKPIKLSERVTVWRVQDLLDWAAAQGSAE